MHMSDALISPAVAGTMYAVSAVNLHIASRRKFDDKTIPLMGVMGAFIFAGQMVNFTIPATGSSGHIGGGILLSALLGPYAALLTITAVLVIQCLLFADGGILALGCNIFNMGVMSCFVAYPLIFRNIIKGGVTKKRLYAASVLSVVVGLQLGAFGVVLETVSSGVTALPFGAFAALIQPIHLAIGLVEGLVTAAALGFIHDCNPSLIYASQKPREFRKKTLGVILGAALLVGAVLSRFASQNPDGLEWALDKIKLGAEMPNYQPQLADYGSVTGVLGIAVTLLLIILVGFISKLFYKKYNNKV
ncbi:cobalamin biosynthesis protein CbiM [Clostridia bacterium]|nr:cobalamin biosynthesis protein CbiM [Clostridia bacterium]